MRSIVKVLLDALVFALAAYVVCGPDRASLVLCGKVWATFVAMAVFVAVAALVLEDDK